MNTFAIPVMSHISDAKYHTEFSIPLADDGVLAENHRFGPVLRDRQLGKNQTDHKGLDQAANDRLQGHGNHGSDTFIGGLAASVTDRVLSFQRKEKTGCKIFDLQHAGFKSVVRHVGLEKVPVVVAYNVVDRREKEPGQVKTQGKEEQSLHPGRIYQCGEKIRQVLAPSFGNILVLDIGIARFFNHASFTTSTMRALIIECCRQ